MKSLFTNKTVVVVLVCVACVLALVLIGLLKYGQVLGIIAKYKDFAMPPESVTTIVVQEEEWSPDIRAVGSLAAVQGVMVSTDMAGIVTKINFESGQTVKQGDLLVQLDINQEQAQLRSAEAQQRLAVLNLQRQQNLLKSRVSAQSDFDAAQAQSDQTAAMVEEVKAMIAKKTITAPFTGVIGIRQVNLGQYLESGAKVAPLQSLDPIYANFWLPQQDITRIGAGQAVKVYVDGMKDQAFEGKINAVDSVIDEATRNIRVQATLPNPDAKLRPGMFVTVAVALPTTVHTISVPSTAIQYAPYGDSIFVVEDMKDPKGKQYLGVRQQVVKLGPTRGDQVAVTSGIKAGEQVVTSGVFKLKSGSSIQINNTILPANEAAPTPEDN